MQTLPFLPQNFVEISKHLNRGFPIILPTETSYGFSGNIFSHSAILAIQKIKNRENIKEKAFLVLVDSFHTLKKISDITKISPENKIYIKKYSDIYTKHTATTFILKKNIEEYPLLNNYFKDFTHIGIRVPQYLPLIGFLHSHKTPLFSTSANFANSPPLYNSIDIQKYFNNIPNLLFVDAGDLQKNSPSSIIKFNENGERIKLR